MVLSPHTSCHAECGSFGHRNCYSEVHTSLLQGPRNPGDPEFKVYFSAKEYRDTYGVLVVRSTNSVDISDPVSVFGSIPFPSTP